jgi:L-cysteine desulfidase
MPTVPAGRKERKGNKGKNFQMNSNEVCGMWGSRVAATLKKFGRQTFLKDDVFSLLVERVSHAALAFAANSSTLAVIGSK